MVLTSVDDIIIIAVSLPSRDHGLLFYCKMYQSNYGIRFNAIEICSPISMC